MFMKLFDDIYKMITLRLEVAAYTAADEVARLIAKLALVVLSVLMAFLIILFLSVALGFGFGRWFGIGEAGGFFVVLGIYVVVALVSHLCRNKIRAFLHNMLAREVLEIADRHKSRKADFAEKNNQETQP